MKNDYPIKYAVMPIERKLRGDSRQVVVNIVSKCYVINEVKKHRSNGSSKMYYEVVFPYERMRDIRIRDIKYEEWVRIEPSYDFSGQCCNSILVHNLFDTYDEALDYVSKSNEEVLIEEIRQLRIDPKNGYEIEKIKGKFENEKIKYKNLEIQIEDKTEDMDVKRIPKPQSIILINGNEVNFRDDLTIYDLIKVFSHFSFCVYSVSEKDYNMMRVQIEQGKLTKDNYQKIKDVSCDKIKYLLVTDVKNNILRIADHDQIDVHGSYYLDDSFGLHYDKNMNQFFKESDFDDMSYGMKIYTTETFDDIINSYKYKRGENIRINISQVGEELKGVSKGHTRSLKK